MSRRLGPACRRSPYRRIAELWPGLNALTQQFVQVFEPFHRPVCSSVAAFLVPELLIGHFRAVLQEFDKVFLCPRLMTSEHHWKEMSQQLVQGEKSWCLLDDIVI